MTGSKEWKEGYITAAITYPTSGENPYWAPYWNLHSKLNWMRHTDPDISKITESLHQLNSKRCDWSKGFCRGRDELAELLGYLNEQDEEDNYEDDDE